MEKFEIFNTENCYICNEFMGTFKSDLTVQTGYSEKPIYQLIEMIANCVLPEEILHESGVCQNCFIKFNEYDEHQTLADSIATDLVDLMDNKLIAFEEEVEQQAQTVKEEIVSQDEELEFEHYDGEETFTAEDVEEMADEVVENFEEEPEGDFQYEIIVHESKENTKPKVTSATKAIKGEHEQFIILETENNQKLFQCDICFKTFKDRSKLRTHREIHTDQRNVICPDCGKAFKTLNCLRNHKRLHVPERTYFNCDRCEKRYTQKVQLKKHIEIVHMQRRDFSCPTCGSSFGTNSVLKMHLLSHQDFRAEKCEICSFRFHTKAKLRRHMKSHTGQRDYECDICQKKFLYSYNVIAHKRNVHEKNRETSYHCKICYEKFWKASKLSEHLLNVHQMVEKVEVVEEETLYEYEVKNDDRE